MGRSVEVAAAAVAGPTRHQLAVEATKEDSVEGIQVGIIQGRVWWFLRA